MANIFVNSLIYGDMELGQLGVIEKIDRPPIPNLRIIDKEILGRNGALYKGSFFEPLEIRVSIRLYNNITRNIDEMVLRLMEFAYSKKSQPLNYRGKRTWYDAVLVGIENYEKYREKRACMNLVFKAYNPLARSKFRIDYYKNFTDEEISINSVLPTRGIFTFTGSSNKITNMRTGEFIEILEGTSQSFVIDCEKEIVTFKKHRAMDRLNPYSDFFEIRNGDVIKANNPVSLKFYERYLYDM